eukprot:403340819
MNILWAVSLNIIYDDMSTTKAPQLSMNEDFISFINTREVQHNSCIMILNVQNGTMFKQLCEQNFYKIDQVSIKNLNQTFLFYTSTPSIQLILKGDLTKTNPVFKAVMFRALGDFSNPLMIDFFIVKTQNIQHAQTAKVWDQNSINYFSHCSIAESLSNSFEQYPLLIITKENNSDQDISNFEVIKIFAIHFILHRNDKLVQCAGDFLDMSAQKISVAFFTQDVGQAEASITTLNFNQTAISNYTFKIFYSSQNGFEIFFYSSFFININSSILAGYIISDQQSSINLQSNQAVLIDLPEPYYFPTGDPEAKQVLVLDTSMYQFQLDIAQNWTYDNSFWDDYVYKPTTKYDIISSNQDQSTVYLPNYTPEFLEKLQERWTIRAGSEATFTLPKYYDPNPEDFVSVKLETVKKYNQFFRVQNEKFIVFNAGFPELGDIEMIVTLSDNHKPYPKSTKYRMTITFLQSPFGQMQNDYVNQVNVSSQEKPLIYSFNSNKGIKIQSISPDGKVKINFEKKLDLSNITNATLELMKALKIKFDDPDVQNYNWTLTNIQEYSLELKIAFTNPLIISQSQINTQLNIILLNPNLFVNLKTNQSAIIQARMPPQIYDGDNDFIKLISSVFNSTLSSLLVTQAGIQILVSQSLQIFWGFVNTQQLISHLPLFQISVPANLYYFYLLVVGSLKFDYLFSSTLIKNSFQMQDNYPAYDENFKNFGYDSSQAIQNMGFDTFILLFSPILTQNGCECFKKVILTELSYTFVH